MCLVHITILSLQSNCERPCVSQQRIADTKNLKDKGHFGNESALAANLALTASTASQTDL